MKLALLFAALAVAAVAGVTASHAASSSVPACPSHTPKHVWRDGPSEHFVRPGATAMRLCRYPDDVYSWLSQHRLIRGRATIESITHAFNRLGEPSYTIYGGQCPVAVADDNSEMLVVFAYPGANTERVAVNLSGCQSASNGGSAARWTTPGLRNRLRHLVKSR